MSARAIFCLAPLLLTAAGCYPGADATPLAPPLRTVEVVELSPEQVVDSVTLIGKLEPWQETTLYFEVTGVVEEVFVESGDWVEEGQPIATLVAEDFQLALSQAIARRETAQARLDLLLAGTRQEDLDAAQADYQRAGAKMAFWVGELIRVKGLFQKGVVPASELAEVQREHDAAQQEELATKARWQRAVAGPRQEEIDAARADVRALSQIVELARRQLEKATLAAPFDGRIEQRFVDKGAYVNVFPTGGVPVVHLVDLDQVDALIAVPERLLGQLAGPAGVEVASAVNPQLRAAGNVVSLSNVADSSSGTYELRVRIPNSQTGFRGGMVVTATITGPAGRPSLRIPLTAVRRAYGQPPHVFLLAGEEDRVISRQVELGAILGDRVEITAGLSAGERLIVRGQHHVVPGDHVRLQPAASPAGGKSGEGP